MTDSNLRIKFESTKIVFESVLRKRTFEKFVDSSMFRSFESVFYTASCHLELKSISPINRLKNIKLMAIFLLDNFSVK